MKKSSRQFTAEERASNAAWHKEQQHMALQRATQTSFRQFVLISDRNGRQEWRNNDDGKIWRTWIEKGSYICRYHRIDAGYLSRRAKEEIE